MESSASGQRFPLRGYERAFTMADHASYKIVHVLTVHSPSSDVIDAFLTHLPQALVLTFNRHPRMRGMQVRGEFATAEIQPKISLTTVADRKLLEICEIPGREGEETESWEQFAQDQWHIPFDRYADLPYYVRAWRYPEHQNHRVRVLLFCDHFMSDGISGMAILNDLITFASELSREPDQESRELLSASKQELPLHPPLYAFLKHTKPLTLFVSKFLIKWFGRMIYVDELKHFTPLIPVRASQADLMVPIQANTSSALFALGTAENLTNTLQRCKEEGVTFFSALAAAVVVAFYIACDGEEDKKSSSTQPFKLALELPVDMRRRVASPVPEVPVGPYMVTNALESFAKEGVDMEGVKFWDLARKTKKELQALLDSFLLPVPYLFLDSHLNSNLKQEFFDGLHVPHSISSDVDVSNVGKYGYETTHKFRAAAANQLEDLVIDSVHVSNSIPHIGSAAAIYVASTDKLSYGFMHKYDDAQGKRLCDAMVASVEHIGRVSGHESMVDVVSAVQQSV
ncbi:Abc transporter b family member 25 [Globisporangium polare]